MSRFLRLTNATPYLAGKPVMINLDCIVAVLPYYTEVTKNPCPDANASILTTGGIIYHVVETFEKITDQFPI